MEPMNLLLVERDADWSQWTSISRSLGRAVLVLVQQADEPTGAFYERIAQRIERGKPRSLNKVVLLRSRKAAHANSAQPGHEHWLHHLSASARQGLRVYPQPMDARGAVSARELQYGFS